MDYNNTDGNLVANLVNTGLVIDDVEKINLVITKTIMAMEEPYEETVSYFIYDATGLDLYQVDQLTQNKFTEING